MREEIKHAAVKAVGGFICIGKCHADCFFQGRNMGLEMSKRSSAQGFMTSRGRFVDRKEAARIARRAKQIIVSSRRKKGERRKVTSLLSEDIWYRKDVVYCTMRGYVTISSEVVD